MRPLLSRAIGLVGMLLIAAAVAESGPTHPSIQTVSALSAKLATPDGVPNPVPRPRASLVPTPAPSSRPAALAAAPQAPAPRPAVVAPPRPPAVHRVIGTGQWGLINQDRAANGLAPLPWSSCLAGIAAANAARMAAQGYISHANGVTLDLGCHLGSRAGENVGYISNGINDAVMNSMFMASPEHRANILGPYHYVGVAWAVAPNGAAYIAVEFG